MATACFSMYSDISKRIILSAEPKEFNSQLFREFRLPTPVGPTKRKLPIGRFGAPNPTRLRRMALAILSTAASCPITCDLRSSARLRSCDCSFFFQITDRNIGFCSTMASICFSVMTGISWSLMVCFAFPCIWQFDHGNRQLFQSLRHE